MEYIDRVMQTVIDRNPNEPEFHQAVREVQVGIDCCEGPPVPIPNTEVKLTSADNTWRVTAREDR